MYWRAIQWKRKFPENGREYVFVLVEYFMLISLIGLSTVEDYKSEACGFHIYTDIYYVYIYIYIYIYTVFSRVNALNGVNAHPPFCENLGE